MTHDNKHCKDCVYFTKDNKCGDTGFLPELKNPHIMYDDNGNPYNYGLNESKKIKGDDEIDNTD